MAEPRQNPFVIDLNRLDEEWRRQPKLSRDAGLREADAKHVVTQAKAKLNVIEARLTLKIRQDPEKFDLDVKPRPNKEVIESTVIVQREYQEALTELNTAMYELDLAEADRVAFIDRRKALENAVELLSINYYAEREARPLSEDGRREMESRQRRRTLGDGIDPDE